MVWKHSLSIAQAAWPAPCPAGEHRRENLKPIDSGTGSNTCSHQPSHVLPDIPAVQVRISLEDELHCSGYSGFLLWLPGEKKSKNKTVNNVGEKKQSMWLKALLAVSQGAQHLPGCISEPLVCTQPPSFPLQWQHRLYSSKTLKHILEL